MSKKNECHTLHTICLTEKNDESVQYFQTFIKTREKKMTFNKSQAINRIISEWAEDRHLTLEVAKKIK